MDQYQSQLIYFPFGWIMYTSTDGVSLFFYHLLFYTKVPIRMPVTAVT